MASTRWGAVIAALVAGIIASGHVGKLPPALPAMRAELGLDILTAGWVASIFSTMGMLVALLLGAFADRIGYWRLASWGLALLAAGGVGGSLSEGAPALLLSRFVEGIGFLAVVIAAPSLIAGSATGTDRRMALGLWAAYMPSGVAIMILAAPPVMHAGGWRGLWIVVAALALAWMAVMWKLGRRPGRPAKADGTAPLWRNMRLGMSPLGPWLVASCFALYCAQLYAIMTWMPTFMIEERGVAAGAAAALTALVVASNGIGNLLGGWLLHRDAAPWAMIAVSGAVMMVAAWGMFSEWVPDLVRYGLALILCGAGGVVASASFAVAPAFAPSPAQVGTINGIIVQASNLGQFIGPAALAAIVAAFVEWESALGFMVGANVLVVLLALPVRRLERRLAA